MNASVGRSPRCLVLNSARASIFGGFPCKADSESSTASGRRDLFVGYRTQSGEYMVANSEGAFKTRTMKRIPENERWNKSEIEGMPWTPWKFKTSSGIGDSFLDIEIDKSISVEEDAMPRRVYITQAVLNQHGITDGCVRCANSTIGGTGMKNDLEQRERIQETKRKRREFIEKHAKKFKVDESAEEEQNDEQMDDIGSRGLKRKAEDNQETACARAPMM